MSTNIPQILDDALGIAQKLPGNRWASGVVLGTDQMFNERGRDPNAFKILFAVSVLAQQTIVATALATYKVLTKKE